MYLQDGSTYRKKMFVLIGKNSIKKSKMKRYGERKEADYGFLGSTQSVH